MAFSRPQRGPESPSRGWHGIRGRDRVDAPLRGFEAALVPCATDGQDRAGPVRRQARSSGLADSIQADLRRASIPRGCHPAPGPSGGGIGHTPWGRRKREGSRAGIAETNAASGAGVGRNRSCLPAFQLARSCRPAPIARVSKDGGWTTNSVWSQRARNERRVILPDLRPAFDTERRHALW